MTLTDKYKQHEKDCVLLGRLGYYRKHFFFQTGGGEDEDGEDIFVKGNVVLSWDYVSGLWYKGLFSLCSYKDGIDDSNGCIDIHKLEN